MVGQHLVGSDLRADPELRGRLTAEGGRLGDVILPALRDFGPATAMHRG
jgi:hypothetical protein